MPVQHVLLADTEWATEYFVLGSGMRSATVMIVGGVHGDEPGGALAADEIRRWRISSGKLVVLPKANRKGFPGTRDIPCAPRGEGQLNRNFEPRRRGALAEAIWQLVCQTRPMFLIDLHEGFDRRRDPKGLGNTIIPCQREDVRVLAAGMVNAVNRTLAPEPRYEVLPARCRPVKGSLASAACNELGINSMIIEATKGGEDTLEQRSRELQLAVWKLLTDCGMLRDRTE